MENLNKVKLMIVDDETQMTQNLCNHFNKTNNFETFVCNANGNEIIEKVKTVKPTILLTDIILKEKDGFSVIENIMNDFEIKQKPKIIVTSALSGEIFISKAMQCGASYYLLKPFDLTNLEKRVYDVLDNNNNFSTEKLNQDVSSNFYFKNNKNKVIDEKISNIFITVGIPAHIKGYQFLREAIKMAIKEPEIINSITKQLYPNIANKFQTSASKVERAIRHAIEVAWNRGRIENINSIFGVKVYGTNDKPTNGEFIALVADKMLIEGA